MTGAVVAFPGSPAGPTSIRPGDRHRRPAVSAAGAEPVIEQEPRWATSSAQGPSTPRRCRWSAATSITSAPSVAWRATRSWPTGATSPCTAATSRRWGSAIPGRWRPAISRRSSGGSAAVAPPPGPPTPPRRSPGSWSPSAASTGSWRGRAHRGRRRGGPRHAEDGPQPPEGAVARGHRTAARRAGRRRAAGPPGPGDARAPLRRGPADRGADRARPRRPRSGGAAGPGPREGRQGTDRPLRGGRRERPGSVDGPGPTEPFPPQPGRLRQRPRRAALTPRGVEDRPRARRARRARLVGLAPHLAPLLRDPPGRRRGGRPGGAGAARTRERHHDPDLHPGEPAALRRVYEQAHPRAHRHR
jgi:hypothetical protein